jgi:hypothetical protein
VDDDASGRAALDSLSRSVGFRVQSFRSSKTKTFFGRGGDRLGIPLLAGELRRRWIGHPVSQSRAPVPDSIRNLLHREDLLIVRRRESK